MDPEKKTTFGAIIEPSKQTSAPPPAERNTEAFPSLRSRPSKETGLSSSPHTAVSTPIDHHSPFPAFYEHRPDTADGNLKAPNVYNHDVESQCELSATKSMVEPTKECTMWPSRAALKAKQREQKKKKSWSPFHRLGKRQRLTAQVVIALLIIGAAVGIGVGVSRAVGGGVWSGNGQTKQIPSPKTTQTPESKTT